MIAGTRMVSGSYRWQGKYIERCVSYNRAITSPHLQLTHHHTRSPSLVPIPSSMPPRLVGCGRGHGTQPDPTPFESIPPFLAAPFRPNDVGQEGGLNERFAAAAAMMHVSISLVFCIVLADHNQMGPPIDTLQDHQSRQSATLPSQNHLRLYSNPLLSQAASLVSASWMSQTSTSTEDTEANNPYPQRHAKCGSRSLVKVTRQMTHYQQEDQDVITTARKLIIIDMITIHSWLTKVNKAVLHSAIRECINQGNAKHNCSKSF